MILSLTIANTPKSIIPSIPLNQFLIVSFEQKLSQVLVLCELCDEDVMHYVQFNLIPVFTNGNFFPCAFCLSGRWLAGNKKSFSNVTCLCCLISVLRSQIINTFKSYSIWTRSKIGKESILVFKFSDRGFHGDDRSHNVQSTLQ